MYHVVILGDTQTGKTTLLRDNILPMLPRFVIFDVEQRDNYNRVVNVSTSNITELIKAVNQKLNVQYCSVGNSPKEIAAEHNMVCKVILKIWHYAIVSDEAADLSSPGFIHPYHYAVLRKGLGRGIIHITATQRPQMMSKHIFTQSRIKILMGQGISDYDIVACKPYIPNIERTKTMEKFTALITEGSNEKTIKVIKRF
jgi:hypothetical protein